MRTKNAPDVFALQKKTVKGHRRSQQHLQIVVVIRSFESTIICLGKDRHLLSSMIKKKDSRSQKVLDQFCLHQNLSSFNLSEFNFSLLSYLSPYLPYFFIFRSNSIPAHSFPNPMTATFRRCFCTAKKWLSEMSDWESRRTCWVGNLSDKVTEEILFELFLQSGNRFFCKFNLLS